MMQRVWLAIARFAARRVMLDPGRTPDGLPGVRDVDARCEHYWPRPHVRWDRGGPASCEGDGHWLCRECWYYIQDEDEAA